MRAYGDSAFFLPSAHPDRVWVVDLDRTALVRAVREVTVDGETTVGAGRRRAGSWPLAAVGDGLLLAARGGVDVWDPATQRVVRHLPRQPVRPRSRRRRRRDRVRRRVRRPAADRRRSRRRARGARAVRLPVRAVVGAVLARRTTSGRRRPAAGGDDAPRRLALVDTAKARAAVVPGSRVPPGYTLVAWSASSEHVFITGGDRFARRVIVGYRVGTPRAQAIDVEVGDFYDLAAL